MLEHDKRNVTTDASYTRASMLLGICNNLDFDGSMPVAAAASSEKSAAPLAQLSLPAPSSTTAAIRAGDEETESTKGIMGGMTSMSFLRNSCSGLQAASPAEPKAKAKAKSNPKGGKNKAGANADSEKPTKRQKTSCLQTVDINSNKSATQSVSVALKLKEDDDAWRNEHRMNVRAPSAFQPTCQ